MRLILSTFIQETLSWIILQFDAMAKPNIKVNSFSILQFSSQLYLTLQVGWIMFIGSKPIALETRLAQLENIKLDFSNQNGLEK